jgi:peroxiredoxin
MAADHPIQGAIATVPADRRDAEFADWRAKSKQAIGQDGPRWTVISAPLKPQLEMCRNVLETKADPRLPALRRWIHELERAGFYVTAVKAGGIAPRFTLCDQRGARVSLAQLLGQGPAVLSFVRDAWCNFCALELKALGYTHREIERLGGTLVALCPASSDKASLPASTFPILKDQDCEVASLYGLAVNYRGSCERLMLRLAAPRRRAIEREPGCSRYQQHMLSTPPAVSFFPMSTSITRPGWSRPRSSPP